MYLPPASDGRGPNRAGEGVGDPPRRKLPRLKRAIRRDDAAAAQHHHLLLLRLRHDENERTNVLILDETASHFLREGRKEGGFLPHIFPLSLSSDTEL